MSEHTVDLHLPAELVEAELETIAARRQAAGLDTEALKNGEPGKPSVKRELTGLALSGGGIRSSTFGIGVIQILARAGLFQRADYISTVSGGG
jgi:predicted acylesterase/phospholipase RssA